MKKVYLVTTQSGAFDDFDYEIISVCSTLEIAEKEKLKIEQDIQNIKKQYFLEFNRDYDIDLELLNDDNLIMENEDKYDELVHRIYNYQRLHPQLNIHTVQIEERELL